jgi:hypothetical protein
MKKFPRAALVTVRETKKDAEARELHAAKLREQAQAEARAQAQAALSTHQATKQAIETKEREALAESGVRAGDLQQLGAYQVRAEAEQAELTQHAEEATQLHRARTQEAEQAKLDLARAHGEHEAALRDKTAWLARERHVALAKEEDQMEEAFMGAKKK